MAQNHLLYHPKRQSLLIFPEIQTLLIYVSGQREYVQYTCHENVLFSPNEQPTHPGSAVNTVVIKPYINAYSSSSSQTVVLDAVSRACRQLHRRRGVQINRFNEDYTHTGGWTPVNRGDDALGSSHTPQLLLLSPLRVCTFLVDRGRTSRSKIFPFLEPPPPPPSEIALRVFAGKQGTAGSLSTAGSLQRQMHLD